ncbi:RNA polymerase sigma factor [Planctomycetota bacterium]
MHLITGKQGLGELVEYDQKSYDSLVARLKAGNRAAAAELVDLYFRQIYVYMRRLGFGKQISEDLTQEAFLQIWQHIGQLRSSRALNSWIYKVAGNVSRVYLRKHKGKDAQNIEQFVLSVSKDEYNNPEHNELLERLKGAVDELPTKFKQAIVLHYMQHLNISDAAKVMGVREGTFKSRLSRALESLRKQIS